MADHEELLKWAEIMAAGDLTVEKKMELDEWAITVLRDPNGLKPSGKGNVYYWIIFVFIFLIVLLLIVIVYQPNKGDSPEEEEEDGLISEGEEELLEE